MVSPPRLLLHLLASQTRSELWQSFCRSTSTGTGLCFNPWQVRRHALATLVIPNQNAWSKEPCTPTAPPFCVGLPAALDLPIPWPGSSTVLACDQLVPKFSKGFTCGSWANLIALKLVMQKLVPAELWRHVGEPVHLLHSTSLLYSFTGTRAQSSESLRISARFDDRISQVHCMENEVISQDQRIKWSKKSHFQLQTIN